MHHASLIIQWCWTILNWCSRRLGWFFFILTTSVYVTCILNFGLVETSKWLDVENVFLHYLIYCVISEVSLLVGKL